MAVPMKAAPIPKPVYCKNFKRLIPLGWSGAEGMSVKKY